MQLHPWVGPPTVQVNGYPIPETLFIQTLCSLRVTAMVAYPVAYLIYPGVTIL